MEIDLSGITGFESEGKKEYKLIPDGEVLLMQVEAMEPKQTKAGGQMINATLVCVDDQSEFYKRKIWESFNVVNASEKAVEIGKKKLKELAEACEVTTEKLDIYDLVGRSCSCTVGVRTPPNYGPVNTIKRFRKYDGIPF
jgi:hypothetical protein